MAKYFSENGYPKMKYPNKLIRTERSKTKQQQQQKTMFLEGCHLLFEQYLPGQNISSHSETVL